MQNIDAQSLPTQLLCPVLRILQVLQGVGTYHKELSLVFNCLVRNDVFPFSAYIKLLKIPSGSRHLRIQEMPGSRSANLLGTL